MRLLQLGMAALTISVFFLPAGSLAAEKKPVMIVSSYRYLPPEGGVSEEASQTGHSLCGVKCNANSANYESTMMAGLRMIKTGEAKEMIVALDNPFLKGSCVCTGDEYEIEYYYFRPDVSQPGSERATREPR